MTTVFWQRTYANSAFRLETDTAMAYGYGVYVIWKPATSLLFARTIRVGSGDIRSRLLAHKADPQIFAHGRHDLRFTYCNPAVSLVPGIERYLAEQLHPLVGDRFPDAYQVPVNLPVLAA